MIIDIADKLPQQEDIDGVPEQFLNPQPKCEFGQLDYKDAIAATPSFASRYRQFYADLYRFHEKYSFVERLEDFTKLLTETGILGGKYPECRGLIVGVFNMIERDYIERGEVNDV